MVNDVNNISLEPLLNQSTTGSGVNKQLTVLSKIVDESGNYIASHLSADGDYHLGTSMEQNVNADANNTSSVNLASGATFAGVPTSTLGVVGLQWSINTDQNCMVYIEQSNGSHTGLGTVETNGTTTLTVTSTANATLTVYDALSAVAGSEITLIDAGKTSGTLEFQAPFSTGLYIVSQANFIATIVYE